MVSNPFLLIEMMHIYLVCTGGWRSERKGPGANQADRTCAPGYAPGMRRPRMQGKGRGPRIWAPPESSDGAHPLLFQRVCAGGMRSAPANKKRCFPGYALGYALRAGQWIIGFPMRWGVCAPRQPIKTRCFYHRDN